MLLEAKRLSTIDIRYEGFADDVRTTVRQMEAAIPGLRDVSVNAIVRIKDYEEQGITNMNERQIGRLTARQTDAISLGLSTDQNAVHDLEHTIRE
jgi:phage terminase Nu1 subunit (DNA packaging protein)